MRRSSRPAPHHRAPLDRAGRPGSGGQTLLLDAPGAVDVDVEVPGPRDALDGRARTTPPRSDERLGRFGWYRAVGGSPPDDDPAELDEHRPGRIVRRKVHTAHPMSVDDALSRMELVGHDFYLFSDSETGAPSVVYRRKGYDYGVICLSH